MDDILELEGLSEEEKEAYIHKRFNMLLKQLPYDFPEIYGMNMKEVENLRSEFTKQMKMLLDKLDNEKSFKTADRFSSTIRTSQNYATSISFNLAPAFKNKLRYLKEFKMKNPPNPHPGKARPPGQSAHPGRAKRNRAYKKRAKLNQTNIVYLIQFIFNRNPF